MFKDMTAIIKYISTWQEYRQCKFQESKMAKRTSLRITNTVADESVAIHVQSDDQVTALKFKVCNCFRIDNYYATLWALL
jgi:hypothetical protein